MNYYSVTQAANQMGVSYRRLARFLRIRNYLYFRVLGSDRLYLSPVQFEMARQLLESE